MLLRNRLGLAIVIALHARNNAVDGSLIQHHVPVAPETVREDTPIDYRTDIATSGQGFRESLRRRNKTLYRELLDAERQDRGLPPRSAPSGDQQ